MHRSRTLLRIAVCTTLTTLSAAAADAQEAIPVPPVETPGGVVSLAQPSDLELPLTGPWGYTPSEVASEASAVAPAVAPRPAPAARAHVCSKRAHCPHCCKREAEQARVYAELFDPAGHYRHPSTFRPLGDAVGSAFGAQVANGIASRMVLRRYDFVRAEAALNPRGFLELLEIAEHLPRTPFAIVIEPSGDAELDAARRGVVLAHLNRLPYPVPEERVVTANPLAGGLDGLDAVIIHQRLLELSATGGGASAAAITSPSSGTPFPQ